MQRSIRSSLLLSASVFALSLAGAAPAEADGNASATAAGAVTQTGTTSSGSFDNSISSGGNDAAGVLHDQQNNGSHNVMNAASAIAAGVDGDGAVTAAAEAEGSSSVNEVDASGSRGNAVTDSFNTFSGEAAVQQNNGDANSINEATAEYGSAAAIDSLDQDAAADAASFSNTGPGGEPLSDESERSNRINPSFNGASGIATVQQNNGSANALSAATSVAGATEVNAGVNQNALATGDVALEAVVDLGSSRANDVDGSFAGAGGTHTVQQNNGDANALSAATAVLGVAGAVQGDLVQEAAAEELSAALISAEDQGSERTNTISDSFGGADGVFTTQQNNGNANVIGAASAVAGIEGSVDQTVEQVDAEADENDVTAAAASTAAEADRSNVISNNAFDDATGVFTVQQNNGDANVVAAATAVAGVGGDVGQVEQEDADTESADISEVDALDDGSTRTNQILGSMDRVQGVATVQQNNGNANILAAGSAVVGVGGDVVEDVQQSSIEADGASIRNVDAEDLGSERRNSLSGTLDGTTSIRGVVTVQQNNGDANVVQSATAVTGVAGAIGGDVRQGEPVGIEADQNVVQAVDVDDLGSSRENRLHNSFLDAQGIITLQQNNGDANVLSTANAVVAAGGSAGNIDQTVAADRNAVRNIGATLTTDGGERLNDIDVSGDNAAGQVTVQQNNGGANVISSAMAVTAAGGADDISQTVTAGGTVEFLSAPLSVDDQGSDRDNAITDSFDNAAGTLTLQQNNGDANVMSVGTAYVAIAGDGPNADDSDQDVATTGIVADVNLTADQANETQAGSRTNLIDSSFQDASGVATVQQNNGSANVMAVGLGVIVDTGASENAAVSDDADTQTAATTGNVEGVVSAVVGADGPDGAPDRQNTIGGGSFNGFQGVATVQQNNGDANVMGAATAVRANNGSEDDIETVGGVQALADTSGTIIGAVSVDEASTLENGLNGAFQDAQGIVTVQQNNGNNNIVGAATGVTANFGTANTDQATVANAASGSGGVADSVAVATEPHRTNTIDSGAFDGASVVATVQQNNGENNVMGASTHVAASENGSFGPAVSLASLSSATAGGIVSIVNADYTNTLSGAFTGTRGVVSVQQNNGANNMITSAVTVTTNFSQ